MSRSLLLASFLSLPLLATACTETPEPPADVRFDGTGVNEDGVWYLPGHSDLVRVSSSEDRIGWSFVAEGPITVDATLHGELSSSTTMRAGDVGAGTLSVVDVDGAPIGELPVHVTYPDRVLLIGNLDGGPYSVSSAIRVLLGDSVQLAVSYAHGDHLLAGHGLLQGDNNVGVFLGDRGDSISLTADAGPYRAWMSAGPDASRFIDVVPTPARDVSLRLVAAEAAHRAGDTVFIEMRLRMTSENDSPVFHTRESWFRDGAPIASMRTYTYDPSAPPSTIEVRVGVPGQEVVETVIIHAAP